MSNTTLAHPTADHCEPFPPKAREYLDQFYALRKVSLDDVEGKIQALRKANDLEDTIIAADGGIDGPSMELHALEFYVLTKQGLL